MEGVRHASAQIARPLIFKRPVAAEPRPYLRTRAIGGGDHHHATRGSVRGVTFDQRDESSHHARPQRAINGQRARLA